MPSLLHLPILFLIFVRVLSILMTAPIFSHRSIPALVKIGLAGLLSLLLLPIETGRENPVPPDLAAAWPSFLLMIAQEILIGVLIGFVSNLIFVVIDIAARIVSLQIGFQAASLFDPLSSAPTSALEQFYTLLTLSMFLAIDGHHWLIAAIGRTFNAAPLGTFVFTQLTLERLIFLTGETFVTAMRIALPVMGILLFVDLGLGLIARAVPQVQVFFLGLPLKMGLGFLVLALTLSGTLLLVKGLTTEMVSNILMISSR